MATSIWNQALDDHELIAKSFDDAFWREYLGQHPDVLHRILADLYEASSPARERPPTLDDLWELVAPKFSHRPFGDALLELLGDRSVRWLAGQINVSKDQLRRLMLGTAPLVSHADPRGSMLRIEAIARALKVHPSYFAEWRRLWLIAVLDGAMTVQPNISIGLYRKLAAHEKHRANGRSGASR